MLKNYIGSKNINWLTENLIRTILTKKWFLRRKIDQKKLGNSKFKWRKFILK